jgi:hypothetical protein
MPLVPVARPVRSLAGDEPMPLAVVGLCVWPLPPPAAAAAARDIAAPAPGPTPPGA